MNHSHKSPVSNISSSISNQFLNIPPVSEIIQNPGNMKTIWKINFEAAGKPRISSIKQTMAKPKELPRIITSWEFRV